MVFFGSENGEVEPCRAFQLFGFLVEIVESAKLRQLMSVALFLKEQRLGFQMAEKGNTLNFFQRFFYRCLVLVYVSTCPWDNWKACANSPIISGT